MKRPQTLISSFQDARSWQTTGLHDGIFLRKHSIEKKRLLRLMQTLTQKVPPGSTHFLFGKRENGWSQLPQWYCPRTLLGTLNSKIYRENWRMNVSETGGSRIKWTNVLQPACISYSERQFNPGKFCRASSRQRIPIKGVSRTAVDKSQHGSGADLELRCQGAKGDRIRGNMRWMASHRWPCSLDIS